MLAIGLVAFPAAWLTHRLMLGPKRPLAQTIMQHSTLIGGAFDIPIQAAVRSRLRGDPCYVAAILAIANRRTLRTLGQMAHV